MLYENKIRLVSKYKEKKTERRFLMKLMFLDHFLQ